jgi:hypothetical protein
MYIVSYIEERFIAPKPRDGEEFLDSGPTSSALRSE